MKRKSRATAAQLRDRTAGRKTSRLNAPRAKTSRAKVPHSGDFSRAGPALQDCASRRRAAKVVPRQGKGIS